MSVMIEMPKYKSHKEVWALKIKEIRQAPSDQEKAHASGDWYLIPEDDRYGPILVGHDEYVVKHRPEAGGYYVVYADGYKSFSPALAFESGNTRITPKAVDTIEQEILEKGLTAPRITPADIEANIASEHYFTARDGVMWAGQHGAAVGQWPIDSNGPLYLLTFCVLVLRNGFTVTGESACASPENFNAELGRKSARSKAVEKIRTLMGYELRSKLEGGKA